MMHIVAPGLLLLSILAPSLILFLISFSSGHKANASVIDFTADDELKNIKKVFETPVCNHHNQQPFFFFFFYQSTTILLFIYICAPDYRRRRIQMEKLSFNAMSPTVRRPRRPMYILNLALALVLIALTAYQPAHGAATFSTSSTGHFRKTGTTGLTHTDSTAISVNTIHTTYCRAVAEYSSTEILYTQASTILKLTLSTMTLTPFAATSGGGHITTTAKGSGASWKMNFIRWFFKDIIRGYWIVLCPSQIVKLYGDGDLQMLAGSLTGTLAYADGTGTAARFYDPFTGYLSSTSTYVFAEISNNRVREVTYDGVATTRALAGTAGCSSGTTMGASIERPHAIAHDKAGRMWISTERDVIAVETAANTISIVVGSCDNEGDSTTPAYGTSATIKNPYHIVRVGDVIHVHAQGHFRTIEPTNYRSAVLKASTAAYAEGRVHIEGHGSLYNTPMFLTFKHNAKYDDYFAPVLGSNILVEVTFGRVVAHYTLDGTGRDMSGNDHHLTTLGTGLSTTTDYRSKADAATTFDGTTNAFAVIPNTAMYFLVNYCVCMWVEVTTFPATLFSLTVSGTTPYIDFWTDGTNVYNAHGTSTFTQGYYVGASAGWRHLCAWRDGQKIGTSIMGVKDFTGNNAPSVTNLAAGDQKRLDPTGIVIGQRQGSALGTYTRSLAGRIGDVTILNYMPTQHEIQQMMREEYAEKEKTEVWITHQLIGSGGTGATNAQSDSATFEFAEGSYREFTNPGSVTFTRGFLFTDVWNHCIRKVDEDSVVTTAYGVCGASGNNGGAAAAARFTNPSGFHLMAYHLGYIVASSTHLFRIDHTAATVYAQCQFVLGGTSTDGACGVATGRAVTDMDMISVTEWWWPERYSNKIRRYQWGGGISTIMGTDTGGCTTGTGGLLKDPVSAKFDTVRQRYWVAEVHTSRVSYIDLTVTPYSLTQLSGTCQGVSGLRQTYTGIGTGAFMNINGELDGIRDTTDIFMSPWTPQGIFKLNKQTVEMTFVTPYHRYITQLSKPGRAFHGGMTDATASSLDWMSYGSFIYNTWVSHKMQELIAGVPMLQHRFFGPTAYYTRDSLGNKAMTTVGSGVSRVADHRGVENHAIRFDNTANGYVDLDPSALNLVSSYSVCMWAEIKDTVSIFSVMPIARYQAAWVQSNQVGISCMGTNKIISDAVIWTTGWNHMCFMKNGLTFHMSLNGEIVGSVECTDLAPGNLKVQSTTFRLGQNSAFTYASDMAVTNLDVFNYALIPAEISQLIEHADRADEIWTVRRVAGDTSGNTHAVGTAAAFNTAQSMLEHPTVPNTLLVTDQENHCIKSVPINSLTATSTFSGLCGTGATVFGDATTTRMNQPATLTHDAFNNRYYLAVLSNAGIITAMDTAGTTSLFCGTSGSAGSTGTTCAAAAVFNFPFGFAVTSAATIYASSYFTHEIRRVDGASAVSTVVGTGQAGCEAGPGATAVTMYPMFPTLDGSGNMWFTLNGNSANGNPLVARIAASTLGTTYTVEFVIGKCLQEMPDWTYSAGIGTYSADGFGPHALAGNSRQMLYDPHTDSLFLSQYQYGLVRRIDPVSYELSTVESIVGGTSTEGRIKHGGVIQGNLAGFGRLSSYPESIFVADLYKIYEMIKGTLRAHYRMHGNGVDASGNGYHMDLGSGLSATTGPNGKAATALAFDQTVNAYAVLPRDALERAADFSVCFFGDIGADNDVTFFSVATAEDFGFVKYGTTGGSSNQLRYGVTGTQITATHNQALLSSGWHHYCVGKNGPSLFIIMDGVLQTTQSGVAVTMMIRGIGGIVLGQVQSTPLAGYSTATALLGGMSELHLYNYAVLPSEAEKLRRAIDPNQQDVWFTRIVAGQPSHTTPVRDVYDGTKDEAVFRLAHDFAFIGTDAYVTEFYGGCIKKVTIDGVVTTHSGHCGVVGNVMGNSITTQFYCPRGILYDATNSWHVVSTLWYLFSVDASGTTTLLAGQLSLATGSADGTGAAASFTSIYHITMLGSNYLVADGGDNRIRQVTPVGAATKVAGSGTALCAPGTGTAAHITQPSGITTDGAGNVWVSAFDFTSNTKVGLAKIATGFVVTYPFGCGAAGTTADGVLGARGSHYYVTELKYDAVADALVFAEHYGSGVGNLRRLDLTTNYVQTIGQSVLNTERFPREGRLRYPSTNFGEVLSALRTTTGSYLATTGKSLVEIIPGVTLAKYTGGLSPNDVSGNGHHMTAWSLAHEPYESTLPFDGTASTLAVVPNSALQTVASYSICFNLMIETFAKAATFLSIATADSVRYVEVWYQEEALHFRHGDYMFTHPGKIPSAVYHHYCFVKDGQALQMYRGGRGVLSHPSTGRLSYGLRFTALGIVVGQAQSTILGTYDTGLSLRGSITELVLTNYAVDGDDLAGVVERAAVPTQSASSTVSQTPVDTRTASDLPSATASATYTPIPPPTPTPQATSTLQGSDTLSLTLKMTRTLTDSRQPTVSGSLTVLPTASAALTETVGPSLTQPRTMTPAPVRTLTAPPTMTTTLTAAKPTDPPAVEQAEANIRVHFESANIRPGTVVDVVVTVARVSESKVNVKKFRFDTIISIGHVLEVTIDWGRAKCSEPSKKPAGATGSLLRCGTIDGFPGLGSKPFVARVRVMLHAGMSLPHLFQAKAELKLGSFSTIQDHDIVKHNIDTSVAPTGQPSWHRTEPPLNEATFGSTLALHGENLRLLPTRLLLGPFVVHVALVNDTHATLTLPAVPAGLEASSKYRCPMNDRQSNVLRDVAGPPLDKAWLLKSATYNFFGADKLVDVKCRGSLSGYAWEPRQFMLSMDRIVLAPLHDGISLKTDGKDHANLYGGQLSNTTVESGAFHTIIVTAPDDGGATGDGTLQLPRSKFNPSNGAQINGAPRQTHLGSTIYLGYGRRQASQLVYQVPISVYPTTDTGKLRAEIELINPSFLQRWRANATFVVRHPTVKLHVVPSDGLNVTAQLELATGYRVLQPQIHIKALNPRVPLTYETSTPSLCHASATKYHVLCNVSRLTHRTEHRRLFTEPVSGQLMAPPYFQGRVNVTVSAWGLNLPSVRRVVELAFSSDLTSTPAPFDVVIEEPSGGDKSPTTSGIFDKNGKVLHFVIMTTIVYAALSIILYVLWLFVLKGRDFRYDFTRVARRRSLLVRHAWIGMFWPCHQHCLNVHLTTIMATVMGMYMWTALAPLLASQIPDLHFAAAGTLGALIQIIARPLLDIFFYSFDTVDDVRYDPYEDVEYYDGTTSDGSDFEEGEEDEEDNDLYRTPNPVILSTMNTNLSAGSGTEALTIDDDEDDDHDDEAPGVVVTTIRRPKLFTQDSISSAGRSSATPVPNSQKNLWVKKDTAVILRTNKTRAVAYTIALVYCALCGVVTFFNTNAYTDAELTTFWKAMAVGFAIEFTVVEGLYIAVFWFYRWVTNDHDHIRWVLHPYDMEVRY